MPSILIVESNTPEPVGEGHSAATGFVRTIGEMTPETALTVVAPYREAVQIVPLTGWMGSYSPAPACHGRLKPQRLNRYVP